MRGGVANFMGTYWPVGDEPAKTFAETFYHQLLGGKPFGQALVAARTGIRESRDWADYVFYGNPDFVLKEVSGNPPS
jgi:CHAT domain-containing protein